jgi:hypothetical protein
MTIKFLSIKNFLWAVYIGVLVVITPHTQWMFARFEPAHMHGMAWVAAVVFEAAIFAVTHLLVRHIEARRPSTFNFERQRLKDGKVSQFFTWWPMFRYRWANAYTALLAVAVMVSGFANLAHAVEYGQDIAIVEAWGIPYGFFAVAFGGILPLVNMLFAAVIAQVGDAEQEANPELDKANKDKRDAERRAKEAERLLADTEHKLIESEQRYRAVGDVVRYLFGDDFALGERVRYVKKTFPQLSQHGISQILGCSVSTVNEALKEVEIIDG